MKEENYIFGIRAIIEAIEAGKIIDKVFILKESAGNLMRELLVVLKKNDVSFSYVPQEKLRKFSQQNHQGAVATIAPISFVSIEELLEQSFEKTKTPLFVVLDQISDARNFGAIIRTAECVGAQGVIIPRHGNAPVNGDAVKTSAGAIFNMLICKIDHIKDAVFYLQSSEINVVAATEKTENLLFDIDFKKPTAIIMGSEDRGINPTVLKIVNEKAKLPINGQIETLNVSVACGAFLYEVVRQRLAP